jgi:hypothetical protein
MYRLTICLLSSLVLNGCVTADRIEMAVTEIDKPSVNEMATAELGSPILEKGKYRVADSIILSTSTGWNETPLLGPRVVIPQGVMIARLRDAKYTYYYSSRTIAHDPIIGIDLPYANAAALRVGNERTDDVIGVSMPSGTTHALDVVPDLERTRVTVLDATGYRRQLIYGGRSGDTLRFQYRETAGPQQPQANQDFEWNLNDGNVVAFRGVRIEVMDAANARLKYRILSSFADSGPLP